MARPIPLDVALPFRRALLAHAGGPPAPGDLDPRAAHFGAFDGDALVAVSSIDPEEHAEAPAHWRLRGVATAPAARRRGFGRDVVEACLAHAAREGAAGAWCHGRVAAGGFYEELGFRKVGSEYDRPGTGPHRLFVLTFPH